MHRADQHVDIGQGLAYLQRRWGRTGPRFGEHIQQQATAARPPGDAQGQPDSPGLLCQPAREQFHGLSQPVRVAHGAGTGLQWRSQKKAAATRLQTPGHDGMYLVPPRTDGKAPWMQHHLAGLQPGHLQRLVHHLQQCTPALLDMQHLFARACG